MPFFDTVYVMFLQSSLSKSSEQYLVLAPSAIKDKLNFHQIGLFGLFRLKWRKIGHVLKRGTLLSSSLIVTQEWILQRGESPEKTVEVRKPEPSCYRRRNWGTSSAMAEPGGSRPSDIESQLPLSCLVLCLALPFSPYLSSSRDVNHSGSRHRMVDVTQKRILCLLSPQLPSPG